ncbi:hypothetical protein DEA41_15095 [Vibrio anguillarum]|nr:hypothetical protein PN51_16795 [Vibrio anguillarum]QCW19895.1 hypothetical protein [Vibrio phage Va_PF430-3_p42]AUB86173.1 hypothetical protein CKY00_02345 [Vibrio anguillarum]AUB89611.1 hypothetical protein CKX99_02345 [Vibrio anguillarum]AUB93053.1 hypothetical protein CK210_02345 [Vibrio anguillarum]
MRTLPMIFNTDMVKALISGDKTVTRRPTKKEVTYSELGGFCCDGYMFGLGFSPESTMKNFVKSKHAPCQTGDLIYVRETFRLFNNSDECGCSDHCSCPPTGAPIYLATSGDNSESKWAPSIHMPRGISRITLKVTDVRIERVQEITEDQCWKEGIENTIGDFDIYQLAEMAKTWGGTFEDAKSSFACLWDSIYKNWHQNPYVWVIEFEVIHQNVDKYLSSIKNAA